MPDAVAAAPAAPSTIPAPKEIPESVQRLEKSAAPTPEEESKKGFRSLDDAFEKHFKKLVKSTPDEAEAASKNKGKEKEEVKADAPEEKAPEKPKQASKEMAKAIDPETIKPPASLKGESVTSWNTMKENAKLLHNENQKLSSKVKDLETVIAQKGGNTQKEIEALKAQIEELKPFRAMVDIQHDPDFRKSYDEPMEASKKAIHKILADLQTPEQTINAINFLNPSQVDKVVAVMEEAGQKTLARRILAHADEMQKINDKRQEALGNSKGTFAEYSKKREESELAKRTEEEAIVNQVVQNAFQSKAEDGTPELPFLTLQELPANATKEQIAQVEAHNKAAEYLQAQVQATLQANDAESRAMTAVRAVVGAVRDAQLKGALQKIHELEGELKRVSSAGSEKKSVATAKATTEKAVNVDDSFSKFIASRKR